MTCPTVTPTPENTAGEEATATPTATAPPEREVKLSAFKLFSYYLGSGELEVENGIKWDTSGITNLDTSETWKVEIYQYRSIYRINPWVGWWNYLDTLTMEGGSNGGTLYVDDDVLTLGTLRRRLFRLSLHREGVRR